MKKQPKPKNTKKENVDNAEVMGEKTEKTLQEKCLICGEPKHDNITIIADEAFTDLDRCFYAHRGYFEKLVEYQNFFPTIHFSGSGAYLEIKKIPH